MPRKARLRRGWNPPGLSGSDALTQGERVALSKIARDLKPPVLYVNLMHEGIPPADAERLLVKPMEQELRNIEGVEEMRSTAFLGGANIVLEFEAGFDVDLALADVREKVDLAKPELPEDADVECTGLADELANVAITYRLMRQQDAKAPEPPVEPTEPPTEPALPKHAWVPQAPPTAEQRRALEHLREDLFRAWNAILSLDAASREVLDLAYRSALFDGTDPKRPRYPLAERGLLEDDQNALDRMVDRAAVALHLLPPAGGARPLHSLRWVVRELATIHTGITGDSFSVGRERDTVDTLNPPAHWVARVVKIIDPDVTDANLRTAFRQDFNTLQIPTPSQGG